jgi:hypothetical protein
MFQSIAHRYNRSVAIEPLAKKRGKILLTTNNPPNGQIELRMCILGLHRKQKYQHHGMILKVNIRVLTLFFLTKDNVHNDFALVFFIYLKTIKRVPRALLQNTKAANFPRKLARDQLRPGPASIHTRNRI